MQLWQPIVVTIEDVIDSEPKPSVKFAEYPTPYTMSRVMLLALTRVLGNHTSGWIGKKVTLYPSVTRAALAPEED